MKIQDRVAGRFIQARNMKADYGDVDWSFNVFDYFESVEGGTMTPAKVKAAEELMQEAISSSQRLMDQTIKTALRRMRNRVYLNALKLK